MGLLVFFFNLYFCSMSGHFGNYLQQRSGCSNKYFELADQNVGTSCEDIREEDDYLIGYQYNGIHQSNCSSPNIETSIVIGSDDDACDRKGLSTFIMVTVISAVAIMIFFIIMILSVYYSSSSIVIHQTGGSHAANDRRQCRSNESFQLSAQRNIPNIFTNINIHNRSMVEILRLQLGTFSFAYFPLTNVTLHYHDWYFDKHDPGSVLPYPILMHTNYPIEVLVCYTESLYRVMGDLEDASKGGTSLSTVKVLNLGRVLSNLTSEWNRLYNTDIAPGLSWAHYLSYPGPRGRVWFDGTVVSWAIPFNVNVDSNPNMDHAENSSRPSFVNEQNESQDNIARALYLQADLRMHDSKLWGNEMPKQYSSTISAITALLLHQLRECQVRYHDLMTLDKSGAGHWATAAILSSNQGIDVFHAFRKGMRTLSKTIEAFPDSILAFYEPIPDPVKQ